MTKNSSSIKSYIINPPDKNSPQVKTYSAKIVNLQSVINTTRLIQALRITDALRVIEYDLKQGERVISISQL
jgi:hypothetical protein